jgi:hypothetical protein
MKNANLPESKIYLGRLNSHRTQIYNRYVSAQVDRQQRANSFRLKADLAKT